MDTGRSLVGQSKYRFVSSGVPVELLLVENNLETATFKNLARIWTDNKNGYIIAPGLGYVVSLVLLIEDRFSMTKIACDKT